jgi:hypothetical protein
MQVAPIRSPMEMLRAQERLMVLASSKQGTPDEIERRALRDAIEHYCCITGALPTQTPRATPN